VSTAISYPAEESHKADLEEEYQACLSIGVKVEWADRAPVPGLDTGMALRFPNQGRFHPTKYLRGLAQAILNRGGRIYANTVHVGDKETDEGGVEIETEAGPVIRAGAAVFCTNSPTNDKVVIHSKQPPSRTYAIAGPVPKDSVPDVLAWDTLEAYHYVRIQPLGEAEDLLIVGGEDHHSGEANDMDERFARLESWTRERYPSFTRAEYRWSGQVLEPIDFMPYSGRNPGSTNIYVHSGDSGMGITNGVAGSLTILPLILGEDSRYAPVLDPSRKSFTSTASIGEFVREQAGR
jgi:glycine/D-amino acid oxidase-like deaminating enzyme